MQNYFAYDCLMLSGICLCHGSVSFIFRPVCFPVPFSLYLPTVMCPLSLYYFMVIICMFTLGQALCLTIVYALGHDNPQENTGR